MSKTYLGANALTPETREPASEAKFEFLRECAPTSILSSEIRFVRDRDHIDRVELGEFAGQRFLINKTRFAL